MPGSDSSALTTRNDGLFAKTAYKNDAATGVLVGRTAIAYYAQNKGVLYEYVLQLVASYYCGPNTGYAVHP